MTERLVLAMDNIVNERASERLNWSIEIVAEMVADDVEIANDVAQGDAYDLHRCVQWLRSEMLNVSADEMQHADCPACGTASECGNAYCEGCAQDFDDEAETPRIGGEDGSYVGECCGGSILIGNGVACTGYGECSEQRPAAAGVLPASGAEPTLDQMGRDEHPVHGQCDKCMGSGKFQFGGAVVNGVFTGKTGICYACKGKGYQTEADRRRNWGFWQNYVVSA